MLYRYMNDHSDVIYVGMTDLLSITDDHISKLAGMIRMIGDPSRLRIILVGMKERTCVSDVAARTRLHLLWSAIIRTSCGPRGFDARNGTGRKAGLLRTGR
jgi:hypothetical protein